METPELDKMLVVKEQSQIVSEFLGWLDEQEFEICAYTHDDDTCVCGDSYEKELLLPVCINREQLIADFLEIDLAKCEEEHQQIIADLRKHNG